MKPSIGRTVHFVQNKIHYAATIVKVWTDTTVNLFVLPNGSDFLVPGATDAGANQHGAVAGVAMSVPEAPFQDNKEFSWHWPEREGE